MDRQRPKQTQEVDPDFKRMRLTCAPPSPHPPGSMVSPNSVPTNLDGSKGVERRPSKAGVSRESSSVDFSKVTPSRRPGADTVPSRWKGSWLHHCLSLPFLDAPPETASRVWAEGRSVQKPPSHRQSRDPCRPELRYFPRRERHSMDVRSLLGSS